MRNTIKCCDCRDGMRSLQDACIDLTVTSPPYAQMRTYGGHRYDFDVFQDVAHELARITKPGGVICWVVQNKITKMKESLQSEREKLFFVDDCGLWPYQTIIATGMAALPVGSDENVQRYSNSVTHNVYVFTKGRPRVARVLRDRENRCAGAAKNPRPLWNADGTLRTDCLGPFIIQPRGRRTNVWFYRLGGDSHGGHPSKMCPRLARDLIWSYSRPGDLVFDPFCGSATTLVEAILHHRDWLGFEAHAPYVDEIAWPNIRKAQSAYDGIVAGRLKVA